MAKRGNVDSAAEDGHAYEHVASTTTPDMEPDDANELQPHENMKEFESDRECGSEELMER